MAQFTPDKSVVTRPAMFKSPDVNSSFTSVHKNAALQQREAQIRNRIGSDLFNALKNPYDEENEIFSN